MSTLVRFEAPRLHLLGDVHGRWDRVEQVLRVAKVCDEQGRWSAPAGTVLLQVGDLVDRGRRKRTVSADELERARESVPSHLADALGRSRRRLGASQLAVLGALDTLRTLRSFMRLEQEAAAAGSRSICLLGNHEIDLLRGEFLYFPREKECLLSLCGVDPALAGRHARDGVDLGSLVQDGSPELQWLAKLPLVACGAGVLAVHGGPTRRWCEERPGLGISDLDGLAAWLQAGREQGYDHEVFREGRSLFSPDAPEDDAVRQPELARDLLSLSESGRFLAVGHSPFLHFPKRQWKDLEDPAVRDQVEAPALLAGCVLKLDTNMKRGGPAWLVSRQGDGWRALREDGRALELCVPTRPSHPAAGLSIELFENPRGGGGAAVPTVAEGIDGREHMDLLADSKRLEPELAQRVRTAFNRLLFLGLVDLAPVRAVVDRRATVEVLEEFVAAANRRVEDLAAGLRGRAAGQALVHFLPELDAYWVEGRFLQLGPTVARQVLGELDPGARIVTASYFHRRGAPHVRLHVLARGGSTEEVLRPLSSWPPDPAEVSRLADALRPNEEPVRLAPTPEVIEPPARGLGHSVRAGPPLPEGPQRETALRWTQVNAERLPASEEAWEVHTALDLQGQPVPSRCVVSRTGSRPWALQALPDGHLLPLDVSLADPSARFLVDADTEHPGVLLDLVRARHPGDPLILTCAVSAELECLLRMGEVDGLGLKEPDRPVWQRGQFLFCCPDPAACSPFAAYRERTLEVALPWADLEDGLTTGLLTLNLFVPTDGEPILPEAPYGAADVGLEVVALGAEGVALLCEHLQ